MIYTVNEMKRFIDEYGLSYSEISEKSGVPISTVQKIFGGLVKKPRKSTLESLSKVFIYYDWKSLDKLPKQGFYSRDQLDTVGMVAEKHQYDILYNKGSSAMDISDGTTTSEIYTQSGYTYNDYVKLKLPDGVRVEVLDGQLIKMDAPATRHQAIAGEIYRISSNFIRSNKGKCIPFISPVDVRLEYKEDGSDRTIFEPDVLIVCDRKKIEGGKTVNGAPDFVVEVLSPSNRKYEMYDKLNKYRMCGVREYWVVDYDRNKIIKHFFEYDGEISMYTFEDKVPVDIYEGKLTVDFASIKDYIESIF